VLRDRTTDEFRKGMVIGFALALVIIGLFGFFALNDIHPSDVSRLQFGFMLFTAIGIFGFITLLVPQKKKKKNSESSSQNIPPSS
jgi:heme/copper-type cytochrome/quinol oxidase subunit 4